MIKAIPFDYPYDGRLVAENTALIVIDLQQDFLSTTGYFARKGYDPSPLRAILPTVNRLIAAARRAGLTVVHTRQGYRADMADRRPTRNGAASAPASTAPTSCCARAQGSRSFRRSMSRPTTSSSTRPATAPSPIRISSLCCARGASHI